MSTTFSMTGWQVHATQLPTNVLWLTCLAIVVLAQYLFYRARTKRLAAHFMAMIDRQTAERSRFAHELHDTVLQTIRGSELAVEITLDNGTDADLRQATLERLLGWLQQADHEGRSILNAIHQTAVDIPNLVDALRCAAAQCLRQRTMVLSLSVAGNAVELRPVIRSEVYRIAHEAIRNACEHSEGGTLRISLIYEDDFELWVSDDGKGFDARIRSCVTTEHFGINGMQERAAHIGGALHFSSSPSIGTTVTLKIPGNVAYDPERVGLTTGSRLQRHRRTVPKAPQSAVK